jgi:hypothetical protein
MAEPVLTRTRRWPLMYLIMAYCFGAFTTILVLGLLYLGWQHHREDRRQRKAQLQAFKRD